VDAYDPEAVRRAVRLLREPGRLVDHRADQLSSYNYIENNEPELALGELAHARSAFPRFWRLLADAAASLKLTEDEPYHGPSVQIVNRRLRS
jgi:hypothetical protein